MELCTELALPLQGLQQSGPCSSLPCYVPRPKKEQEVIATAWVHRSAKAALLYCQKAPTVLKASTAASTEQVRVSAPLLQATLLYTSDRLSLIDLRSFWKSDG